MSSLYEKAVAKRIKAQNKRSGKSKYPRKLKGIEKKRAFLISKGYDLSNKDDQFVNNLYRLYFNQKKSSKHEKRDWELWKQTNRPHHLGGSKPKNYL